MCIFYLCGQGKEIFEQCSFELGTLFDSSLIEISNKTLLYFTDFINYFFLNNNKTFNEESSVTFTNFFLIRASTGIVQLD